MRYWLLAFVLGTAPVWGASMDYCRPFAAQVSQALVTYAWNRAYTYCLNQDEDPAIPDMEGILKIVVPTLPVIPVPRPEVGDVPATGPDELLTPDLSPATHSAEWNKACHKRYPASFRKKDGTVIPYGRSHKRVLCPL